jgi:hypothetical protein
VVSPASLTIESLSGRDAPIYGELIAGARALAEHACSDGCGPFLSASHGLSAAINYERFLAVAGRHLRLLTTPAHPDFGGQQSAVSDLHELVRRMATLELAHGDDDVWGRAATQLAAAHDLLSTHVGPVGELRTPEAVVLDDPVVRGVAAHRLLDLVASPLERCGSLLSHAYGARRGGSGGGVSRSRSTHLRQSVDAVRSLVVTLNTGRSQPTDRHLLAEVDALAPALPRIAERPTSTRFETSLDVLRVLRLLSYRQSLGHEQSSPGCLHDLTRLAVVTSRAAEAWLPAPATPLARVQHAVACDELHAASAAWEAAATALGQHIRGLTKAPRLYSDAVRTTTSQVPHNPTLGAAVLAALPRLGEDAGGTFRRLAETGSLVLATKEVGRFQASWRMLAPDEARHIAGLLGSAGQSSNRARSTYLLTLDAPQAGQRPRADQPALVRRQTLTAGGTSR